uniref:PDZ domain-containing protein n=1 Tax=Anisakis simplex TaxID=6269 RepID=A0A0M3K026_ANISI
LEVELSREQTANVATLKYPASKQPNTNISSELHEPKQIQQQQHQIESFRQIQQSTQPSYTLSGASQVSPPTSSCVSYTSANLTFLKEKLSSSHQQLFEATSKTSDRTAKEEESEEKVKDSFSESAGKKFQENVTKTANSASAMNTVHVPLGNTFSGISSYRDESKDQFNRSVLNDENVTDDDVMIFNIDLGHHTTNPHKYFGFTVAGGKDKDSALRVETVIRGTPADECGLKAGDLILSINGESVEERYLQSVIRMIHEAARLGEVEVKIRRPPYETVKRDHIEGHNELETMVITSPRSTRQQHQECYNGDGLVSFDEKRSMFDRKTNDENIASSSYNQFKQLKKQKQQTFKWNPTSSVAPRALSTSTLQHQSNGPTPITDANAPLVDHQMSNINKLDAVTSSVRYGFQADHSAASSRPASTRSPSLSPYDDDCCADFEAAPRDRCSTFGSSTDSAIFESSLPFGSSLNSTRSSPRSNNADYRVTSMHDKPEPGKLSDFIPEVERNARQRNQQSYRGNEYDESYKRREQEDECGYTAAGLSPTSGIQPKVVRNYDVTPCRSATISPVQERRKQLEENREKSDSTDHGQELLPDDADQLNETQANTSSKPPNIPVGIGVASADDSNNPKLLPTMAGIRSLMASDDNITTRAHRGDIDEQAESQGHSTERLMSLTPCSWPESVTSTFSAIGDSTTEMMSGGSMGSRSSTIRSGVGVGGGDGGAHAASGAECCGSDKRVTFGWSETHEITPRQTQEIIYPVPNETKQTQPKDRLEERNASSPKSDKHSERMEEPKPAPSLNPPSTKPVEIIHPIRLLDQPANIDRTTSAGVAVSDKPLRITTREVREVEEQEEKITKVERRKETTQKKLHQPRRIPITPNLPRSHVVHLRCSSCNNLLSDSTPYHGSSSTARNVDHFSEDETFIRKEKQQHSYHPTKASSSSCDDDPPTVHATRHHRLNGGGGVTTKSYESLTERFYKTDVRTKCFVTKSLSPQRATITFNCETFDKPLDEFKQRARQHNTDPNRTRPKLIEATDSREWRQIIEQQRLPNAGDSSSRNRLDSDSKFRVVHSSSGSLKDTLMNSSSWSSQSSRPHPPTGITDATRLNRAELNASSESKLSKATAPTSILRTSVEVLHKFPEEVQSHSADSNETMPAKSFRSGRDENVAESKSNEHVVAVSGKNKCSHCGKELGRGAAMIIESLGLFYHLTCFRCYVCNTPLGNGRQGADVRVRDSKLHCQRCYSNDEAGLKFSQV